MNSIELALGLARLRATAEEMGANLRRAALSPNIKDRLDFSCALFDARGELCAQAAHIPVHLGSMAYAMRDIVGAIDWQPGDMVIVNDPYLGGTHLPDVTLVAPLFDGPHRVAFLANRAHHADIGCARPGSMPLARSLAEEGLVLAPRKLLAAGQPVTETWDLLHTALRNPTATLADVAAQISANRCGLARLGELLTARGRGWLATLFDAVNDYAERVARATFAALPAGRWHYRDHMDGDGLGAEDIAIEVCLDVGPDGVTADFTGTAAAVAGNINCPLSVTAAAVYYCFHALMPAGTPPCSGALRPLTLLAPAGCLVNARAPAAVAAGNVETSQRIVDTVLGALAPALPARIPAAATGSMNNVAMGGRGWDYYETIGGGSGAHAGGAGLDAQHTHMTNTLNTPVEVLESTYPLRLRRYAVRRGSGGAGRWRGGDGIVREYEFLAPAALTVLAERRRHAPWGLAGGDAGQPGRTTLNGAELPGKCEREVAAGDCLRLESAGGGGWGAVHSPTN